MKSFIESVEQKIEENKVNQEKLADKIRERQLKRIDTNQKFTFSFGGPRIGVNPSGPHQDKKRELFAKSRILKKEKASKNLLALMKRPE